MPTFSFLLAWTFLNVLINLNYPAHEPHAVASLLASPEVAILLVTLCAAVWVGMPFRRVVYVPLTGLLIFCRLFRIGDVLMPMYFNRDFNLYIDSRYLPDLVHLLYSTLSLKVFICSTGLAFTLSTVVVWGTWRALKAIHQYLAVPRHRICFLVITGVLVASLLFPHPGRINEHRGLFARGLFHRVVEEVDFMLHVRGYRTQNLHAIQASMARAHRTPSSLNELGGASVYIFFVESYGQAVFANPLHYSMIAPLLDVFEHSLRAQGFSARSNFLSSPTFGGTSWLAHGTLASGVQLTSQTLFDLLVTSQAKTLAHYFNEAGYRTISVMPGTRWPWPEGAFFGYRKEYYAPDFDYKGPQYGWSPMPDQYVLDYIYRREIQNRGQPLLIEYVLVSSHAPFNRQPPYVEDWTKIGDGAIFHQEKMITFPIVWPDLSNAAEAYLASIIYELKVLKGYLERYIDDDALVIILGDHQPNVQITGNNRSWSVPIHVISRNPDFLRPFALRGYTAGIIPRQTPPHKGMETFLYNFLQDFSTAPTEEPMVPPQQQAQPGIGGDASRSGPRMPWTTLPRDTLR